MYVYIYRYIAYTFAYIYSTTMYVLCNPNGKILTFLFVVLECFGYPWIMWSSWT